MCSNLTTIAFVWFFSPSSLGYSLMTELTRVLFENLIPFRFKVYSARTSSVQAYSYATSGNTTNLNTLLAIIFVTYIHLEVVIYVVELVLTLNSSLQVISAFLLVSVVFVPIGVASLHASRKVCFSDIMCWIYAKVLSSWLLTFIFLYLSGCWNCS